ncbi:MAG: DUF4926 domain-containing protein [Okeania sp. SIO2G4]|uniref:DUF4926 domain-containing protein n=1 Tax=unclassified Okeania TaxID=2634635 RepID=UPI0013B6A2D8|nr:MULTISPECIES: DUF4926 domain-containing protein [unclassified Okeania]NEP45988.1 DUF4926 domain-containing protein [Okeania sp. SIO2H7]NEP72900.1 DUF4926 domain-containing protein [Okeania sp. SIO2G5]NEP93710.1 DUF4926 domain-containing protein [Okeania sp. SIO2F5]NEQ93178.1 DUF4926 domain-containing protein [Okeania sp. SIO2G4]
MAFPLFYQVQLIQDIPEFNLKKGSMGVIVEYYPMYQGEDGYSVEGLIAQDTVEVTESQIQLISVEQIQEKQTFPSGTTG